MGKLTTTQLNQLSPENRDRYEAEIAREHEMEVQCTKLVVEGLMGLSKKQLVFLAGKRTVFGSFGGGLKDVSPTDLGVAASKAALTQSGVKPEQIDHVVFGQVLNSASDSIYTARHIGLKCGIPEAVPAYTVNRVCISGLQAILEADMLMKSDQGKTFLVGGTENMSMTPFMSRKIRWGNRLGHMELSDGLIDGMQDTFANASMAITAETLAEKFNVSRKECDEFAVQSHQKASVARVAGKFQDEVVLLGKIDRDEHTRPDVALEKLAKLPPHFKQDGVITAGNASGIVDGAAALVVAEETHAKNNGWKPLGKLVSYAMVGCDGKVMGIGAALAAKAVLAKANMTWDDIDLIEMNEAFAAQTLACIKDANIPIEKLNVNGGSLAIGHPLAASGSRLIITALYELQRRKAKRALITLCGGGGMGGAAIIEAVPAV